MKTRCRGCRVLIGYGTTYCPACNDKFNKYRRESITAKTKEADKLTKTSTWQSLRREIIRRDKGCCVLCLLRGIIEYRKLQVHHIVKRSDDPTLAYERSNLVTLCRVCHEEVEKLPPSKQRELLKMEEVNERIYYLL